MAHLEKPVGDVHIHNRESESVRSLLPFYLRQSADRLIALLEDYYVYLNERGQATNLIDRIQFEHDVDYVGDEYLQAIKDEIANGIPNSNVIDNRKLLRKIIDYYYTRGSDRSAETFFRIFFDDTITITYPRERLFKTSDSKIVDYGFQSEGVRYSFDPISESFIDVNENPVIIPTGTSVDSQELSAEGVLVITGDLEAILFDHEYDPNDTTDRHFAIEVELVDNTLDCYVFSDGLSISAASGQPDDVYPIELTNATLTDLIIDYSTVELANAFHLATYTPGKRVYEKSIDTNEIRVFQERQDTPHAQTYTLSDVKNRHIYYAEDGRMSLIAADAINRTIPLKAAGKYFGLFIGEFNLPPVLPSLLVLTFYALENSEVEFYLTTTSANQDDSFDFSRDANPSYLVETRNVKAGQIFNFIVPITVANQIIFVKSSGLLCGSLYGKHNYPTSILTTPPDTGAYNMILTPMSNDYLTLSDRSNIKYFRLDYNPTTEIISHPLEDGFNDRRLVSSDTFYSVTFNNNSFDPYSWLGIPTAHCKDTYIVAHRINSSYIIVNPYDNNVINSYYWNSGDWTLYKSHDPASIYLIETNLPTNTFWKFEGTYPFGLWLNDDTNGDVVVNAGDRDPQYGFNRNEYNVPTYSLYSQYDTKNGFVSDVNRIHDGEYWQEFSYVISTGISIDQWEIAYKKLVHPAGLRLFSEIAIESRGGEILTEEKVYDTEAENWPNVLYLPKGYHMPLFQPGWLDEDTEAIANIVVSITIDPLPDQFIDFEQNHPFTYTVTKNTPTSGLVVFTLDTTDVETLTGYTINDGELSPTEIGSGTFDTRATDTDTTSIISWYATISGFATATFVNYAPVDIPVVDLANIELTLNDPLYPVAQPNTGNAYTGIEFEGNVTYS